MHGECDIHNKPPSQSVPDDYGTIYLSSIYMRLTVLSSTLGVATNDMTTTGYARPDAMVRFHGPA